MKISTNLTLTAVWILRKTKRSLFFFFLFLKKPIIVIEKIIFKRLFLPIYKICILIKKWAYLIWGRFPHPSRSKFFSFLTHRQLIHVFIFLITCFVVINNFQAEAEQGQPTKKTILKGLNQQEIEIIKEGPLILTKENNHIKKEAVLKTQPHLKKEILEKEISPSTTLGETALINPIIPTTNQTPKPRKKIEYYIVQSGDVISAIAEKFRLRVNTILWANNLSFYSIIKPGQKITILPVDGLLHKIKSGDSLEKIAKKYKVKIGEITKVNKLALNSQLEVGEDLVIPGAKKTTSRSIRPTFFRKILQPRSIGTQRGHIFPWGHCTWWVAQKRYVPWRGHAKHWIANARRYGYSIGNTPVVGAIIVTKESWWGHVAYVEAVSDNRVTFSEMNHYGLGVVSRRTLKQSDWRIIGYIY